MAATPETGSRFQLAAERFKAFFDELNANFLERQDTLTQVALALLGREHVLMTGPPGTAKSQIASAVLGRILDETTGNPSVFARQFTESTVQTDLVGPLDFKTLMSTGRTEHFTDEGMLGAIHAFLDEVLDGRDMLLRSTLNVLHERELKQGTRTTKGLLECALMTSNRYLSEVLEGARETLLAFVDRVAFVSFVPRGFGEAKTLQEVLRRQVSGKRPPSLRARLTIQDLDVLQAAVDGVYVPEPVCDSLCALLGLLERELAAAYKADPSFLPTRYLSTRTAVRTGRILRSVAVYDRIFNSPQRPLRVRQEDLSMLRLTLLLAGPPREAVERLLVNETDPRERRQLSIIRSEREIFEQCLANLPAPKSVGREQAPVFDHGAHRKKLDAAGLDVGKLLDVLSGLLLVADAGDESTEMRELLDAAVTSLHRVAVAEGLSRSAEGASAQKGVITRLANLADGIERAGRGGRPVACWLRGRVVQAIDELVRMSPVPTGATLDALTTPGSDAGALIKQASGRLDALEKMAEVRSELMAKGAVLEAEVGREPSQSSFADAAQAVEDDLVLLWDTALRAQVAGSLRASPGAKGPSVLRLLAEQGEQLDAHGKRLARLGATASSLKTRVVGPRLSPLVRAAIERMRGDVGAVSGKLDALLRELDETGLEKALPPGDVLGWALGALLACVDAAPPEVSLDAEGYRKLRSTGRRSSMLYVAVELSLRLRPPKPNALTSPLGIALPVIEMLRALPDEVRSSLIEADLGRLYRVAGFFEGWWQATERLIDPSPGRAEASLKAVVDGRFYAVTQDEGALTRFALEGKLLAEVFTEASGRVEHALARLVRVERESLEAARRLAQGRADHAWAEVLGVSRQR